MYVNTAAKKEDNDTVAQFMASDTDNVKKNVQSAVVNKGVPIKIGSLNAQVNLFAPGGYNRYEAVAYIDSPKVFITYVIRSFQARLPRIRQACSNTYILWHRSDYRRQIRHHSRFGQV
jgi:hypothetical protein